MGVLNSLDIVFKNYFPDEENYDSLFHQFYEWLNDDEKNMMFVPAAGNMGFYLDLCNTTTIDISAICEYWCEHIKLDIHNGEGFVIKG